MKSCAIRVIGIRPALRHRLGGFQYTGTNLERQREVVLECDQEERVLAI